MMGKWMIENWKLTPFGCFAFPTLPIFSCQLSSVIKELEDNLYVITISLSLSVTIASLETPNIREME